MAMECNKDEAIRAKEIAEKKMLNNDFDGARRLALKAQQLFPELENITQLLAVCNVHCSAESRIFGSEKDWYSILQVERLADEVTIKKQYRKLALVLHPDKNRFPGAEAAFKLVGEAHLVLSDRGKRSLFDSKLGISLKPAGGKPPSRKANINPPARKQSDIQSKTPNGFTNQFSGLNHHQTAQPDSTARLTSFWTCCPFCSVKYLYGKDYVNRVLRCQKCLKPYVAYDIAAQGVFAGFNQSQSAAHGVRPNSNSSQSSFSKPNENSNQRTYGAAGHSTAGPSASDSGFQGNGGSRNVGSVSGTETRTTTKVGLDNKTKDDVKNKCVNEYAAMPKEDARKPGEAADIRYKNKKRGRKQEPDSSESCDTSSGSDLVDITVDERVSNPACRERSGVDPFHVPRRSSRHKHKVSYNESGIDDDDFESPPKRSREGKSSSGEGLQEGIVNETSNVPYPVEHKEKVPSKGGLPTSKNEVCKNQTSGQAAGEKVEIIGDSDSDDDKCPQFFNFPDSEFNDFEKLKEEKCFAVDQFWACYDDVDGMPRFHAHIRKVNSNTFKLRITWLEPDPDDEDEIDWANKKLPVGCGKFRHGSSEYVTDRPTFSHQVLCEKGSAKGSFVIYPRKGETWALFKDWDTKWCSDPDNHQQYKYEIVEVVSDFVKDAGVEVVFLEKARGFVGLFRRRSQNCTGLTLIPPNEKYRFSHRIPSFKMSGTERDGVPEGSFELDLACLPSNPDDICYPFVVEVDANNLGSEANSSHQEPCKINKSNFSGSGNTPKKPADFVSKSGFSEETCKLRRSPRGLKSTDKETSHANANNASSQSVSSNHFNGNEAENGTVFSPAKDGKDVDIQMQELSASNSNSIHQSLSPGGKGLEELFYDFEEDRSECKFKVGEIWAVYTGEHKLPKMYVQIKKIATSPFMLCVAQLECCSMPKNDIQPVCGTFKVKNGKLQALEPRSFSHKLQAQIIDKNMVPIYPQEGQVWALYRKWNAEVSSLDLDLENSECELVEILGCGEGSTRAAPLVPLKYYKSVFRSRRRPRSGIETVDMKENELARFSHQIPAFPLTIEKGGSLSGAWQLDPASVPRNLVSGK